MGTPTTIRISDLNHDAATTFLDRKFPLRRGSHSEVSSYLLYFDHLLAISNDGTITSMVTGSHFISSDGSLDGPCEFVLNDGYTQVHVRLRRCRKSDNSLHPCIEDMRIENVALAS